MNCQDNFVNTYDSSQLERRTLIYTQIQNIFTQCSDGRKKERKNIKEGRKDFFLTFCFSFLLLFIFSSTLTHLYLQRNVGELFQDGRLLSSVSFRSERGN